MTQPKVTYIISNITRWVSFEWVAEGLIQKNLELEFILLNPGDSFFEEFLKSKSIPVIRIQHKGLKDIFKTLPQLIKTLRRSRPDIIHAHFLDASVMGMMAGKILGIKKRIYTRRHSTSHHLYNKKGVLYDKLANFFATHIVATCENVKQVLIEYESVPKEKIIVIHHGFQLADFDNVKSSEVQALKHKYNPNGKGPVVGVVARQIELKGIQYTIPAFKKFLEREPNALLVLANGYGDSFSHAIDKELESIPQESFVKIFWEDNLFALYKIFDIFVHVPIDPYIEAYGQVYIEALASSVPSIVTASGIAKEMLKDHETALFVDFKNSEQITKALVELSESPELVDKLNHNSRKLISSQLNVGTMNSKLEKLYLREAN